MSQYAKEYALKRKAEEADPLLKRWIDKLNSGIKRGRGRPRST